MSEFVRNDLPAPVRPRIIVGDKNHADGDSEVRVW